MKTIHYLGFIGSIEFSEEDNCYFGKVLNIPNTLISYEGDTLEILEQDFKESIDYYLKQNNMKFYTHEEMLDKHIGKKGTLERDKFDKEVQEALKQ